LNIDNVISTFGANFRLPGRGLVECGAPLVTLTPTLFSKPLFTIQSHWTPTKPSSVLYIFLIVIRDYTMSKVQSIRKKLVVVGDGFVGTLLRERGLVFATEY
jgi:hypothetical protein